MVLYFFRKLWSKNKKVKISKIVSNCHTSYGMNKTNIRKNIRIDFKKFRAKNRTDNNSDIGTIFAVIFMRWGNCVIKSSEIGDQVYYYSLNLETY